uniref:Uncharacterized protein n=1 Tax=Panagrolaimus sp. ES5 TaxID=591445 RepID=A0AC34F652_9BILA
MEYPIGYMLEYWRTSLGRWARYKDNQGNEIISGNSDTQTSVLRVLDGAIIAKNIRLIPVSEVTRTVCMRVEIHGCTYRDTLQSYTIPQGSHIDGLELRDLSYDGDERDDGKLINGIGKLFDGVLGNDNFELEPGAWIGWHKNDATTNGQKILMEFNFNERRNFTAISLHTSNSRKLGAELFSEAVVLFSTSDDYLYSSRIVKFEQQPDLAFETSRWVRIPINSRLAKKLRIDLTFGDSAEYLLISEIKFESNNVAFRLPDTIDDDTTDNTILTIDSQNAIEIISSNTVSKQTTVETLVYIFLPFSLAVMFLIALACYLLLPRHGQTPLKLQSKPLMGDYYDQQCCGTSSRSNASTTKRYAPTPEKLSYDDSEYADPDIEAGISSKHYAATNLLQQSQYSFAPTTFCPTVYSTNRIDDFYSANLISTDEYAPIEISRESLEPIKSIGAGEFGSIELCRLDNCLVAVKTLKSTNSSSSSEAEKDFLREINVMSQLKHQNVVRVVGASTKQSPILCITEYMENGDLKQFLTMKKDFADLTPEYLLSVATQIAAGMAYLESRKFVHRDCAARNCLVDSNGIIKISDFGMARSLYASDYYRLDGQFALPIRWMAPESIFEGRFSHKTDAWSLAVTIWEIFYFCKEKPFSKLSDSQVIENLQEAYENGSLKEYLHRPPICPPFIYTDLLLVCWKSKDSERPSLAAIHRLLQSAQCRLPTCLDSRPPPPKRAAPNPPRI